MPIQTDEELAALPKHPPKRSSPQAKQARQEFLRDLEKGPEPVDQAEKDYQDDLAKRMKL